MGRSTNTLKVSDITVTPTKLHYSAEYADTYLGINGISIFTGSNGQYDIHDPNYPVDYLTYRSIRALYYTNYISGSLLGTGSGFESYLQSTAASGTYVDDWRYFPTESDAKITVISIPRERFGENIGRGTFSIIDTINKTFAIIDDGNGNVIDTVNDNVHVGNILYNQGMIIVTNPDYLETFINPNITNPVREGLILELYSDIAVDTVRTASYDVVEKWYDQSGYVNDFIRGGAPAGGALIDSIFGDKPGILMSSSFGGYLTSRNFVTGSDGNRALTVFVVYKDASSSGAGAFGGNIFSLQNSIGDDTGKFIISNQLNTGIPYIPLSIIDAISGSNGVNSGKKTISTNALVNCVIFDFDQSGTSEVQAYINNSPIGFTYTGTADNSGPFGIKQYFKIGGDVYGSNGDLGFYIGSVLVYNRILDSTEIDLVYNFLTGSFSI